MRTLTFGLLAAALTGSVAVWAQPHSPHDPHSPLRACCQLGPAACDQTSLTDCTLQGGQFQVGHACDFATGNCAAHHTHFVPVADPPCGADTNALPTALPNQTTCNTNNKGGPTGCTGGRGADWTLVGSGDFPLNQLALQTPAGPARFYRWISGNTTCFYLYRYTATDSANGVLCFDTSTNTCDVRACDYEGNNLTPAWADLQPASSNAIQNCSECHAPGPIAPTKAFYAAVKGKTSDINNKCAKAGGPRWVGAPASWIQGDAMAVVNAPQNCDNCHDAFVTGKTKGSQFCGIAQAAFSKGARKGAMAEKLYKGGKGPGATCQDFRGKMGCPNLPCPPIK